MFETIDDPVANGRCTDYITYPYFQADYRTIHNLNGSLLPGGGLGNWYDMLASCVPLPCNARATHNPLLVGTPPESTNLSGTTA